MKKLFLAAAFLAFGFANAQENKSENAGFSSGDVFMSGSISITSSNDKNPDVKKSGFEVMPKVGYFFTENIALGAKFGFASAKAKEAGVTVQDDSAVEFGVFGRYYFTPASQFSVFTELGVAYTTLEDKIAPSVKTNIIGAGLSVGLNYFVSKNFALEANYAALGITSSKRDTPGAKNVSSFGLGANLSAVSIGLLYKF
jgi:outer membrane protein